MSCIQSDLTKSTNSSTITGAGTLVLPHSQSRLIHNIKIYNHCHVPFLTAICQIVFHISYHYIYKQYSETTTAQQHYTPTINLTLDYIPAPHHHPPSPPASVFPPSPLPHALTHSLPNCPHCVCVSTTISVLVLHLNMLECVQTCIYMLVCEQMFVCVQMIAYNNQIIHKSIENTAKY